MHSSWDVNSPGFLEGLFHPSHTHTPVAVPWDTAVGREQWRYSCSLSCTTNTLLEYFLMQLYVKNNLHPPSQWHSVKTKMDMTLISMPFKIYQSTILARNRARL